MCWIRKSRIEIANPMKRSYTPVLAVGIGAVAGLRTLAAPGVLAWAVKRGWIRLGKSPFATIISAKASKRITDLAVSELIADKLPFTPSRLKAGPLASRIVSGAVCGATIYGVVKKPLAEGAVLGGVGAIAGAFSGYHMRKRLSGDMPSLGVAVLEDALAIGGAVLITALAAQTSD
jgi:uncharacterized membrane protein